MIVEFTSIFAFLALGLGLGILHAFDPDHIAAVGGMSASPQQSGTWQYSLQWSMGHGSALILVAIFVFLVGTAVPDRLSSYAERSVGVVLILIGLLAFYRILYQQTQRPNQFSAPLVGLLHGTAGSAPLLALIPLAQLSQPLIGVVYVLFFSLGVLLAMAGFGYFLSYGFKRLSEVDALWLSLAQMGLAAFSLLFGLYLLVSGF